MTNEELDEARAKEAGGDPVKAARLARENWTPPEPEPVDPDVLAFRKWYASEWPLQTRPVLAGRWDSSAFALAYLAGARMARKREQERANAAVAFAVRVKVGVFKDLDQAKQAARLVINEYPGEA